MQFRKRWLAFGARIAGKIVVDDGCAKAVRKAGSCSILAAGITDVEGEFEAGNTISVINKNGHELARGLTNYSSDELEIIKERKLRRLKFYLGTNILMKLFTVMTW